MLDKIDPATTIASTAFTTIVGQLGSSAAKIRSAVWATRLAVWSNGFRQQDEVGRLGSVFIIGTASQS
jgi:hypothetical protein